MIQDAYNTLLKISKIFLQRETFIERNNFELKNASNVGINQNKEFYHFQGLCILSI